MRGGTRVGQAYVAMVVDGDGVNEDIIDAFDDVDLKSIGDKHGKDYEERFRAHLKGFDSDFDDMVKSLNKAVDSRLELEKHVSNQLALAFGSGELDRLVEHVGREAGVKYGHGFDQEVEHAVINSVEKAMQKAAKNSNLDMSALVQRINASGAGDINLIGTVSDEAVRNVKKRIQEIEAEHARSAARFEAMWERAHAMDAAFDQRKRRKVEENLQAEIRATVAASEKAVQTAQREADKTVEIQTRMYEQINSTRFRLEREQMAALEAKRKEYEVAEKQRAASRGGGVDTDRIAGMFGKNSRNDFLHATGSAAGGIASIAKNLGGVLPLLKSGQRFASGFAASFRVASDSAGFLKSAMAGFRGGAEMAKMGQGLMSIGASLPVLAAVAAMFTVLVSVAGALLGILVAVAATIASALVGALAVAGAGLMALVASAGLLTAAFVSMNEKQKTLLKESFAPLKKDFLSLGRIMANDMSKHFATWGSNLQNALALARPVAQVMGDAFGRAGDMITKSFSGPGFQMFMDTLAVHLPGIVKNLSAAFGNFMNGMMGLFSAIMPYVSQFAAHLRKVAGEFANWATSAAGQNQIRDFVDRAVVSLKALWEATKSVMGFVADLLFNQHTQGAGNTIFEGIRSQFEKFRASISDGSLERWMSDSIKFGKQLWVAMKSVGNIFKQMYDSGVIDGVSNGLKGFSEFAKRVTPAVKPIVKIIGTMLPFAFTVAFGPIQALVWVIEKLVGGVKWLWKTVQSTLPKIGKWFGGLGGKILGSLGDFGSLLFDAGKNLLDGLMDGIKSAWEGVKDLLSSLTDALPDWKGPPEKDKTLLKPAGQMLMEGLVSGLASGTPAVERQLRKTTGLIGKTVGDRTKTLVKTMRKGLEDQPVPVSIAAKPMEGVNGNPNIGQPGYNDQGHWVGGESKKALDRMKGEWKNPYIKWANSLIDEGPSIAAQIRQAIRSVNKEIRRALKDSARAETAADAKESLKSTALAIRDAAQSTVDMAQDALNSAASDLAGATTRGEAQKALKAVRKAQRDLRNALADQRKIERAAAKMDRQAVSDPFRVSKLLAGMKVQNATLADYARARERVSIMLENARERLTNAIELRDSYKQTVADAARSFGSLLTAEKRQIDGVEQALTSGDITANLEQRLAKIKAFQQNLQLLLARGLSEDAYKQLVDAGVDSGSEYAQALVEGGFGAIGGLNSLVSQIDQASNSLGLTSSNHLYQAGVSAAEGLVKGLESLSGRLDDAAARLGARIAKALKKSLGIKSPSRVAMGMMNDVGDGAAIGLDQQHAKVGNAAARLAKVIEVRARPVVSQAPGNSAATNGPVYTPLGGRPNVSGNHEGRPIVVNVHTTTSDPKAVAKETINELTGRL